MITKLIAPDDIYPGPVLSDSLNEIVAVAQNLGANILRIPEDTSVILELAGPATIILAQPADSCAEFIPRHRGTCRSISWETAEPGHRDAARCPEAWSGPGLVEGMQGS